MYWRGVSLGGERSLDLITVVSPHQLKHTILRGRILILVASTPLTLANTQMVENDQNTKFLVIYQVYGC